MAFESLEHFRRFNPDEVILCRKKAKEALALDPNYTFAIGILAWSHLVEVWNGWSKSPRDSMKKAVELADKALTIDENDASSHALLGSIYLAQKKWDKAVEEGERAVELSPSGSDVNGLLGITLSSVGRQKEAISLFEKAIRLNPTAPNWLYQTLARAQILIGNYQDAVISLKRVIEKNHKHLPARRYLIVAYSLSNQDEEAKSQVEEYLKLRPSANIENWKKGANFKNRTDIDLIVNALRKAGLPEKPPPPPVPTKPSIAVLPFANISGDPKEDYLGDGITEQIITALSKIPQMLVIARNSVFTYKGKPVMVQQVGEELGVRYVLEGSFQRSGDRLRVTAQLIDAKTGNHLWSERYDRDLKDLFELQDDITKNVITALQVKLTVGEYASIRSKGTRNLEAYLKVMKADYHLVRYNKDDNEIARKLFEEAIALDPNYSDAYILLAWTYEREAYRRWTKTPRKSYQKAMELAEKAISLDEQKPSAYMLIARLFADAGQIEKAIAMGKKGLSLDPANSLINAFYGMVLNQSAKFKEAIPFYEKAFRTEPKPPWWYWVYLGFSYYWTGQNEKAVSTFKGWVSQQPERAMAYASLGLALIAGGKPEEAVRMFEKALRLQNPPVWCRSNLAIATFGTGKPEEAIKMMNDVASSHPNSGDAYRSLSMVLNFDGKYEEALSMATKAVSLPKTGNKANVAVIYTTLGFSYLMMKQYKEAMSAFKKAIDICPECISGHIDLTAAYSLAGRMEDARAQVAEVLKINPKFSLENIAKSGFYNFQEPDKEHFINALREAGLK
jgi:TolB-like protein/predicted Zn-dependent protease